MYSSHTPARGAVFRNEGGAFDLPSILVGVVVVGILTAGVLATIFGIIPFAQDNAARQDVAAMNTAQGVAKAKDGRFMTTDELVAAGYLSSRIVEAAAEPGTDNFERVASTTSKGKGKGATGTNSTGSCYLTAAKSGTGTVFFSTSKNSTPQELTSTSTPDCLTPEMLQSLIDSIGGLTPSASPAPAPSSSAAPGSSPTPTAGPTPTSSSTPTPTPTQTPTPTPGPSDPGTPTAGPTSTGVTNVLSWGRNSNGMLGQGIASVTANSYVAAGVTGLPGKASIVAAGIGTHQCAVVDGAAYCWGNNNQGQLGNNTKIESSVPVKVQGLEGKTVTGIGVGTSHTCALANGAAYCWGQTGNGEIGNGTTTVGSQLTATPVTASGVLLNKTITAISVGGNHACVIANGAAYCWGRNFHGQIGYPNNTTQLNVPAAVVTTTMTGTVTSISAGNQHTCAVAAGKAYCWGAYTAGQLGSAKSVNQFSPIAVTATTGILGGKTVTSVSTGGNYSCAIANGAAYCWGSNSYGTLGTNNTVSTTVPVAVTGLTGTVTELSASSTNTCAITNEVPYCWGGGHNGSNGDGTTVTTQRNAPTLMAGITGPVAHISMGNLAGLIAYK
jgi:alpha-tubulin suppressor-like RCC1 family protein/type II secretory pathway pseudopilin PulG